MESQARELSVPPNPEGSGTANGFRKGTGSFSNLQSEMSPPSAVAIGRTGDECAQP